ncbi:MAG TPA: zinc ribbon domain-containing protein [Candidatus Pullichristensenella stercoripullorum]|nr:zinc ribbon domain-containing protein [Candidatus Pullichristensenella stercoripullorum]
MASFFSDLGKTFQSAAKTIQKKTVEGMEATRRNSELRSLRDEQKKLFAALGEAYYTSRDGEGGKEQLDLLVRRIDELAERIEAVTAEIDALNDKKRCPGCGAVVDLDAKFCPSCGAKMPASKQPEPEEAPEAPRAEYCPGCGALKQGEARFCAVCGQPFASEEAKSEDAPKPEVEIHWPEASAEEPPVEEPAQDGDEQP